ncbi:hypothetical protein KQ229_02535 [Lactobacillus helveticus]|uniref:Uncharacterized protein n=4 Tax=Bacillati TaxID=1783272 RepID=A0A0D5MHG8_LACHE|nr:hypothetical protein [Lactobacillus helveticus]EGF36203.1 hypothetical protein AAULH_00703 [Lactobacillus helveticus MTCC 5463]AJY60735.1 hypothetical protein HUO_01545 [Lactobacillus helveticus]AKG65998.1 hypothetical protein TU99_00585 [Lactobacillus helveticus]ANZ56155.1 hypothetical protein BCM45_06650 [Lactobacillus helveticus]AUI73502.1 hypothetical protein Lh8105_00620 [Lactobacillus helveticus]
MKKNTLVKIIGSISLVSTLALTGTAITSNNENTVVAASSTIKIDRTKAVKIFKQKYKSAKISKISLERDNGRLRLRS